MVLENKELTAQRLKDQRKQLGITMTCLAHASGVSQQTIKRLESCEVGSIKQLTLECIGTVLNCTEDYLLGLTDDPSLYEEDGYDPIFANKRKLRCTFEVLYESDPELFGSFMDFCRNASIEDRKLLAGIMRRITEVKKEN